MTPLVAFFTPLMTPLVASFTPLMTPLRAGHPLNSLLNGLLTGLRARLGISI
jgi:hypothetical protein